ncbi:MAG: hypothetical protein LBU82_06495 [Treponema sp.]|jgi:hypothetical protein|nr:hypothetical protein [Treponema sp.]
MRKFFISLFILLILGGAVFLFGWAQFWVPAGSYGVFSSKTHGIDPVLVKPGEFRWVWYRLLPTNVQVLSFRMDPQTFTINAGGSLPSGDTYAAFAGQSADFSWELNAAASFSLNPDILVNLVTQNNITNQETLNAYNRAIAEKIKAFVLSEITSGKMDNQQVEKLLSGGSDADMEREISGKFPEIRNLTFAVQSARFPDFALYRHIRLLYEDFLNKQREYMAAAMDKKAEDRIDTQLRFNELERYGELLTKYPSLLQYLELEKNKL